MKPINVKRLRIDCGVIRVCVCVCCRPIYSERRFSPLRRASRGPTEDFYFLFVFGSPPSFCGACLFLFIARRVQHCFPSSTAKSTFCVPTTKSLSTVGCSSSKNPRSLRDLNPRPNRQKVTRIPTEPPGRPSVEGQIDHSDNRDW